MPFEFKAQHDFDLHIALEVSPQALQEMLAKGGRRASTRAACPTMASSTRSTSATPTAT